MTNAPELDPHGLRARIGLDRNAAGDQLIEIGHPLEWHTYPMEHQVCLEELQAIGEFLRRRFDG